MVQENIGLEWDHVDARRRDGANFVCGKSWCKKPIQDGQRRAIHVQKRYYLCFGCAVKDGLDPGMPDPTRKGQEEHTPPAETRGASQSTANEYGDRSSGTSLTPSDKLLVNDLQKRVLQLEKEIALLRNEKVDFLKRLADLEQLLHKYDLVRQAEALDRIGDKKEIAAVQQKAKEESEDFFLKLWCGDNETEIQEWKRINSL